MRYRCQPCDHRWWQHRDPDPEMRFLGLALIGVGLMDLVIGLSMVMR